MPKLLTPGAAETLSIKIYRTMKTRGLNALDAVKDSLTDYQNPVPAEVMEFQIALAAKEASDVAFVPPEFRRYRS